MGIPDMLHVTRDIAHVMSPCACARRYRRHKNTLPSLVALLAQEEVMDQGEQVNLDLGQTWVSSRCDGDLWLVEIRATGTSAMLVAWPEAAAGPGRA